jgi:CHASE1-domain containing sensor protein
MEIASLIISAVSATSSLLIALIVYRFTKNQAKLQLTQTIRSAFMAIDQVAIGDKKSPLMATQIPPPVATSNSPT